MRKHRNANQDKIFLKFMTAHPGLARGFCRGDKVNQEKKWTELANLLNDAGPPNKEVFGWKKTWIDWKLSIKKKLYRNINGNSDGESEDKYELSRIERSITFICDLEKQVEKRDDTSNFIYETSNPFPSPTQSPKSTTKRKNEELGQRFVEALNQNATNQNNYDVEIKMEKEDPDQYNDISRQYHSIDSSSNLNASKAKKLKNDKRKKNSFTTMSGNVGDFKEGNTKEIIESIYSIGNRLQALEQKYDKLIDLKKEQIEEMKKDREERRRHNLEIEKYNNTVLALKSEKEIV